MVADIDVKAFRAALGSFMTGVTVVTTRDEEGVPRGFTANSFTSVSLEPPMVLVCIGKQSGSFDSFARTGHFCVNILSEGQKEISGLFAARGADRFATTGWSPGKLGSPVLEGVSAWFECALHERVDAGDHVILIGRVEDFAGHAADGLGYYRGSYITPCLTQSLLDSNFAGHLRVGVLLEQEGSLVLLRGSDGKLHLPTAKSLGPAGDPHSLYGLTERIGLKFTPGFLYSVFEDALPAGRRVSVYYCGNLDAMPGRDPSVVLAPVTELPLAQIADENEAWMLRRYARESLDRVFSVYSGSTAQTNLSGKGR